MSNPPYLTCLPCHSQADWARAAVISSIALLRLPPPHSATLQDKGRVDNLVGHLTQVWCRTPEARAARSTPQYTHFSAATAFTVGADSPGRTSLICCKGSNSRRRLRCASSSGDCRGRRCVQVICRCFHECLRPSSRCPPRPSSATTPPIRGPAGTLRVCPPTGGESMVRISGWDQL